MSEILPDSAYLAHQWCPTCEPHRDPVAEILETRYCEGHMPPRTGADDWDISQGYVSGSGEAGGEDNKAFCDLIHRKKTLLRGGGHA